MSEFTLEVLDKILSYPTIKKLPTPNPAKYFERFRYFSVGGYEYSIEWYRNIRYLSTPGNVLVRFEEAKLSNTWPHASKMNIQFYDEHGGICCILNIDRYESQQWRL